MFLLHADPKGKVLPTQKRVLKLMLMLLRNFFASSRGQDLFADSRGGDGEDRQEAIGVGWGADTWVKKRQASRYLGVLVDLLSALPPACWSAKEISTLAVTGKNVPGLFCCCGAKPLPAPIKTNQNFLSSLVLFFSSSLLLFSLFRCNWSDGPSSHSKDMPACTRCSNLLSSSFWLFCPFQSVGVIAYTPARTGSKCKSR